MCRLRPRVFRLNITWVVGDLSTYKYNRLIPEPRTNKTKLIITMMVQWFRVIIANQCDNRVKTYVFITLNLSHVANVDVTKYQLKLFVQWCRLFYISHHCSGSMCVNTFICVLTTNVKPIRVFCEPLRI